MSAIELVGWSGTAIFFSRWLIQWYASERAKKSVVPISFWWVSLAGTAALGTYTMLANEPILLVGYAVNVAIYTRNLVLATRAGRARGWSGPMLATACVAVAGALVTMSLFTKDSWRLASPAWMAVGITGLVVWNSRWALQWWYSEKKALSHFPPVFWWVSLAGNTLLLTYTIHLGDPILVCSYLLGPVIQTRNLVLERRAAKRESEPAPRPVATSAR